MKRPNRFLRFVSGVFLGLAVFALSVAGVYVGRMAGGKLLDYLDFGSPKEKVDYTFLKWNFKLGFERNKEVEVFAPRQAAMEQSTEHVTQGTHSLWVEFPAGRSLPGIATEVYGRDCFDWSDMEEFSFDVYNGIELPARLTVKLKSGRQDPKKQYETTLTLPAQETGRVRIYRRELESVLDLECVSGINIFMQDPATTYYLYFDNFRVVSMSRRQTPEPEVKEVKIE